MTIDLDGRTALFGLYSAQTMNIQNIHTTFKKKSSSIQANFFAGLTVGIIALPLSMALAIAVGAPPQHGLYTAIVAGIITSLTGSSRTSVSGPTAAFVVILLPITQQYGLGGLLMSGMMAGVILVVMGFAGLGSLIKFVPYPVTVGFTAGIGMVIATIQIKDFFGLSTGALDGYYIENVVTLAKAFPSMQMDELAVAALTLLCLILWPKLKSRVPGHLVALLIGGGTAWAATHFFGAQVETIGTRFYYTLENITGSGIPPVLPAFAWPWELPDASGMAVGISFELLKKLTAPALAIALLGALESLLCAVVADGMSGKTTEPNRELIGQGIGNIVAPLFGGIPATAALARTAANIRAGGTHPVSAVIHSLFILLSILVLAPLLAFIPMASMAALLIIVAWNMSEVKHFAHIIKAAQKSDIAVLLTCFSLTVLLDMEVAVAAGLGLAGMLFIKRTIELTHFKLVSDEELKEHYDLPPSVAVYDINGPMFFGAAHKAIQTLTDIEGDIEVIILDMRDVTMIDTTASVAVGSIMELFEKKDISLIISNLKPKLILNLRKAGIRKKEGKIEFSRDLRDGIIRALDLLPEKQLLEYIMSTKELKEETLV